MKRYLSVFEINIIILHNNNDKYIVFNVSNNKVVNNRISYGSYVYAIKYIS